ncbi:unnamed protein product, partial [Adineta steineri]
MARRS